MQPDFSLVVDGAQDITEAIRSRLISLELTDQKGMKSDTLTITVTDDSRMSMPREGAEIDVKMGYVGALADMGLYRVDDVELSGMPALMVIHAHSADMRSSMKERKTRGWETIALIDCLRTIAGDHGLGLRVHSDFAAIVVMIERMDQTNESDYHFLTRLAQFYHANFKMAQGMILFSPVGTAQSTGGASLPVIQLQLSDLKKYTIKTAGRSTYHGAKARWRDTAEAVTHMVQDGVAPFDVSSRTFATEQQATNAVKTMRKTAAMIVASGSIDLMGDVRMMFGTGILLHVKDGVTTNWKVDKAVHTISDGGYVVRADIVAG